MDSLSLYIISMEPFYVCMYIQPPKLSQSIYSSPKANVWLHFCFMFTSCNVTQDDTNIHCSLGVEYSGKSRFFFREAVAVIGLMAATSILHFWIRVCSYRGAEERLHRIPNAS